MLKALELVGFKSFADKTRFEFSQGITAVVGPNGSGKSNVVDAIKWVLGEQSVKSLRGKEMVDVIFNGSGSRPPLNTAETTLVIDNRKRILAIDSPEVHITRRVYRSGEGEYLINRQPSRLRDIRELFAGTGVSAEAYSIIEQGKVDMMLQSSPKERRLIFEEAAGISRFKTKKVESLRRLERVEQNLLRLSDIVSEVESRLRSVRMQASKARRYKEHVDRLQQVRTQVGLADWQKLSSRLDELEKELQAVGTDFSTRTAEADAAEAHCGQLDAALATLDDALRASDSQLASNNQRIAACEATISHEMARSRDLDDEIARQRGQLNALGLRAGDLRHQLNHTLEMLAAAQSAHAELQRRLEADDADLAAHGESVNVLRARAEQLRTEQVALLRTITALDNTLATLDSQVAAAAASREQAEKRLAELSETQTRLREESEELVRRQSEQEQAVATHQAAIDTFQKRLVDYRRHHAARTTELNQLRQRHSGASERAAVLSELESRLEGVNAGTKEVLMAVRRSPEGPYRAVRGLVADLFRVNMEMAPLVDLALGEKSQFLVVGEDEGLFDFLGREAQRFKGRVGLLPIAVQSRGETTKSPKLEQTPGVVGRADKYVEASPELAPLVRRLLGNTWIVENLTLALGLYAEHGHGISLVTLAGELLAADGSLSIGPRQGAGSLISRRSELRVLRKLIADIESTIGQVTVSLSQLEQQMASDEQHLAEQVAQQLEAVESLASARLRASEAQLRLSQCEERQSQLQAESLTATNQWEAAQQQSVDARRRHGDAGARLATLEGEIATTQHEVAELLAIQHELERGVTATKIELAKSEERLENLTARHAQSERDQQERQRAIDESRKLLTQCIDRGQLCQRQILAAESDLAELYLDLEHCQSSAAGLLGERDAHRTTRAQRAATAQQHRLAARKLEERQHAVQLSAHEVRHERQTLADRLREDYGIELSELDSAQETDQELAEREIVEQEIADLRRKVQNLGNVNLDALAELEELEARFGHLSEQHNDLTKAKNQLEQIIHRINADSRRLFSETLEIVKQNFQALFRKLFGGGHADVILEEGVDILESGIEIIARPPGKEPRNISLLSGGEKTLTCVALLLAIFQYRPSPFCVLDEVDAALDEANIERFITVLQEFLAWTQFIVVTHSKKTMTCAATLYGVTMEESGISKRVAVRFDDVSASDESGPTAPDDGAGSADHEGDETQAA